MLFTIVLSTPAPAAGATVHYSTADQAPGVGHAVAGSDYVAVPDTLLTFASGEQIKTVSVSILADADATEPDETFLLNLSNATGANITVGQGVGTIKAVNAAGTFIITELRTSGPAGAGDDFVELYNSTSSPVTIAASDGSAGFGVFKIGATCNDVPVLIGTVPNGTMIPARGHFLLVGSAYSLGAYATGDQTLTADVDSDANVGVFSTTNLSNLSTVTRLDAVGFGSNTANNCALLLEGTPLAALSSSTLQYSFFRDSCGKGGNVAIGGLCPTGGQRVDKNNNLTDFLFADTAGSITAAGQRLGAPGPENLTSPVEQNPLVPESILDPTKAVTVSPNRLRDTTPDPANNATFGSLTVVRKFTNNTGGNITRLRFRLVDFTSMPVTGAIADLRGLTSTGMVQPVTGVGDVTVVGTTVETQVAQPMGGAMNSAFSVALATPLASGGTINVQFKL